MHLVRHGLQGGGGVALNGLGVADMMDGIAGFRGVAKMRADNVDVCHSAMEKTLYLRWDSFDSIHAMGGEKSVTRLRVTVLGGLEGKRETAQSGRTTYTLSVYTRLDEIRME